MRKWAPRHRHVKDALTPLHSGETAGLKELFGFIPCLLTGDSVFLLVLPLFAIILTLSNTSNSI